LLHGRRDVLIERSGPSGVRIQSCVNIGANAEGGLLGPVDRIALLGITASSKHYTDEDEEDDEEEARGNKEHKVVRVGDI
jgi:hypothetical protein